MLGLTSPDWLDADNLRHATLAVGLVALAIAFMVIRFVQKVAFKVIAVVVLVAIAALAWYQRANLSDCAQTCECKVIGITVQTPRSDDTDCVGVA